MLANSTVLRLTALPTRTVNRDTEIWSGHEPQDLNESSVANDYQLSRLNTVVVTFERLTSRVSDMREAFHGNGNGRSRNHVPETGNDK